MRYYVNLDPSRPDDVTTVDVEVSADGHLKAAIGGRRVVVDVHEIDGRLSMIIDGRVVDLTVEGAAPDLGIVGRRERTYVRVESERQRAAAAAHGRAGKGESLVRAPMPGRIVKVLVSAGDHVKTGDSLIVMEAMKMENEIRAKGAGVVREVHVAVGDTVEAKAKLITFEAGSK